MKNIFLVLLVISSLFLLACPKETAVRRAAKASYSLSGLTVDAINATGKAYAAEIIDLRTKDKMANALKTISIGGKRFNQTLEIFVRESGAGELPPDKLAFLNKIFSDEVVTPFLEVLQTMKVLSPAQSDYLHVAIAALRSAILVISNGFTAAKAVASVPRKQRFQAFHCGKPREIIVKREFLYV